MWLPFAFCLFLVFCDVWGEEPASFGSPVKREVEDSLDPLLLDAVQQSLEGDGLSTEKQDASPTQQLSLAEAEAEAASWVCGKQTELIFMVSNPKSGSRIGAEYITSLPMVEAQHGCTQVRVFSQLNEESLSLAVEQIGKATQTLKVLSAHEQQQQGGDNKGGASFVPLEKRVRLIAVGGDGSFTSTIMAVANAGVDMNWVAGGIIPTGTGNDLAHTYNWTRASFPVFNPLGEKNLPKVIANLRSAELVNHDSWIVMIRTGEENGSFEAWSAKENRMVVLGHDRNGEPHAKTFVMNNYFGIGFDGLVGVGFDRLRGESRMWNRFVYGLLFLRHFTEESTICDAVDTVFTFNPNLVAVLSNNPDYKQVPRLLPCVSLTFLNSRTIIGGLELWGPSSKLGLRPPRDPRASKRFQTFASMLLATRQDSGDGLVELLSIGSTSGYIRAATVRTNAIQRVLQGPGPYLVTFRDLVPVMQFQVDGEFFVARNLSSISIRKAATIGMLKYRDP